MSNEIQQSDYEPEVVVLYCQHGLCDEAKASAWSQKVPGLSVRTIMMPCSSTIPISIRSSTLDLNFFYAYILRILESGTDAIEIVACPEKSCKFLVGSLRAERRIEYIRGLLEKIGYTPERVGISRKLSQSTEKLIELARARADAVRPLGINPMKKGK